MAHSKQASHSKPQLDARGHAHLAPMVAAIFHEVRLAMSVFDDRGWSLISDVPSPIPFELQHGVEHERFPYNERCLKQATQTGQTVLGQHAGLCDLFVPIGSSVPAARTLVVGPFSLSAPTSAEILDRWRWLSNRQGRMSDPEFAHYVSVILGVPVLDAAKLESLKLLSESLATLMAAERDPERVAARAYEAREALLDLTFADRMWEVARESVDARTEHVWTSLTNRIRLEEMGVQRAPGHALVGLLASRSDQHDEFEDFLQRRAFQRACVGLAWELGNVIAGRVGDHGVTFLLQPERSERTARARLLRVGVRAQELAQKFELTLHLGVGSSPQPAPLSVRYQRALGAAERALSTGAAAADPAEDPQGSFGILRELREKLAQQWRQRPAELKGRFDRYLEAVAAHSGYQLEPARAHVQAGFERLTEPLLSTGALDEKSLRELYTTLDRASQAATTLSELFSAYRTTVSDIEGALSNTTGAHQERSLRRAIDFVKEHAVEPLPLSSVARLAGFAPNYFARLFKEREGVSLPEYVRNLRLRHAKRMLD